MTKDSNHSNASSPPSSFFASHNKIEKRHIIVLRIKLIVKRQIGIFLSLGYFFKYRQENVNPIYFYSIALSRGLHITALHNHFFWDTPKVMFMHIEGIGEKASLAKSVGEVFSGIKAPNDKNLIPIADINPIQLLIPKK
ncbi:DUF1259 domain-containing protein [Legionella sp. CNM-1927-20]|uniref:DUF1259 domain-containing protein n=1 Tax=Legionella sp. CNM-1927-20 TaxID=3422221 RepID=UPI00403ABC79